MADAALHREANGAEILPSPPLIIRAPDDDGVSGRRRGHRPLVDPPIGEGPRGLVP